MLRRLAAVGLAVALVIVLGGSTYKPDTGSYKTTTMRRGAGRAALDAPANFSVTASPGEMALSWDAVSGATGYNVYRRSLPGEDWQPLYTATENDTIYGFDDGNDYQDHAFFFSPYDTLYHIISIDGPDWQSTTDGEAFRHVTSPDLINWTTRTSIDRTDLAGATTEIDGYDVSKIWAPSVVESGGVWYMYFTGVDRETYSGDNSRIIQRIFRVSASTEEDITDPSVWENPAYVFDGDLDVASPPSGMTGTNSWDVTAQYSAGCRDPRVFYDAVNGQWVMTYTVTSTGVGVEAVGIATATSAAGPWTKRGYVTATSGSKAESSSMVYSQLLDSYVLIWVNGAESAWAIGANYSGPYSFSATDFPYAEQPLLEPLTPPSGTQSYPYSTSAVESWLATGIRWGSGGNNNDIRNMNLLVHADSVVTVQYMRTATTSEVGTIAGTSATDTTVYSGPAYQYAVAAVAGSKEGSRAISDTTASYDAITLESFAISYSGFTSAVITSVAPDQKDGGMLWRYRSTVTATEDTSSLASATFSGWTERARYDNIDQRNKPNFTISETGTGLDVGEWYNIEFQAVAPNDPATFSLRRVESYQRLAPPAAISDLAAVQSGSNVVLTWTASTDPYFDHYRIDVIPLATSVRVTLEASWPTAGYTDVAVAAGGYIYYVVVVRSDGTESADSNGAFITVAK